MALVSPKRPIVLDGEPYPASEVPEAAVEECLRVLRALRAAAVKTSAHQIDITIAQTVNIITDLARKHNREIERADHQSSQTGGERPSPSEDGDRTE